VRKLLFVAASATAVTMMAAGTAFAQGADAGPSPEALPPYAPSATSGYWFQWHDDDSASDGCRLVRERTVTPSGFVSFKTRRDCE
jgi:hypothetical protein